MNFLVSCLIVGAIVIIIFGFFAFLRYMNYVETLSLAEKGLTKSKSKSGKGLLRWGIVLSSLGLALSLVLYSLGLNSPNNYPLHLGPWMLGGFVPLFLGIGLVLVHYLMDKE